jgi:hypothetical protein
METVSLQDVATVLWGEFKAETFPVDNPAWERISLHSMPLSLTKVSYVAAASGWIDFISYDLPFEWTVVIKQIMMTSEGDQTTNGIEYRIRQNRAIPGYLTTAAGIDLGKTGSTSYPAIERDFAIVTDRANPITIQVRNISGAPVRAIAGLFGWKYKTNTDNGTGNRSGIADV